MHYVWRTARCLHAWRSDTVAAMNTRREEWHAAELKARDYENKAQIDSLREALYQESQIKDAVIDRLHKANEDLLKAQQANGSVHKRGHEQLVTQIELLQELLRTTNLSLAALEERCKSQERELETLRRNAAANGARDALQLQEMQNEAAMTQNQQMHDLLVVELRKVPASSLWLCETSKTSNYAYCLFRRIQMLPGKVKHCIIVVFFMIKL